MPRPQQIRANVFAATQEIPNRFLLVRRDVDGRQGAGAVEDGELGSIAAICFDAITGTARDQGRSDDLALDPFGRQRALQLEAARAGFITAPHRSDLTLQPLGEAQDGRAIRGERVHGSCPLPRQKYRRHCRGGMLIERNQRSRLHGDRPPLYAALL